MHTTRTRLLAATAVAAAGLALAQAGGAVGRYTDATGDGGGAPDITGVTVQSDGGGQLLFQIGVADIPPRSDVTTFLVLNTDANAATGDPEDGSEYYFVLDEEEYSYWFGRWDGTDWVDTPSETVRIASTRTAITISVNRSELGDTEAFSFWTRTRAGAADAGQTDRAPEEGEWHYALARGGPAIEGVYVTTKPGARPKAGAAFTVVATGLKLPQVARGLLAPTPETHRCTATLAGKPLRGTGPTACTWKLDRRSRGKQLVVQLTVTYQGATATFRFPYRVA
jgi:hypothetical protein